MRNGLCASSAVFSTCELLERILRSAKLRNKDLLACSIVCKCWSDVALDRLWSTVAFHNLFCVFPSLKKSKAGGKAEWSLSSRIRSSHWARFLFYSSRITSLEANFSITRLECISVTTLTEIAFSRPAVALFPKLRKLSWTHGDPVFDENWVSFSRTFLHEGLAEIHMSLPQGVRKVEDISVFLEEIPARSPNVSFLSIHTVPSPSDGRSTFHGLQEVISALPNLAHLSLSGPFVESRLIACIASPQQLTALTLQLNPNRGNMKLTKSIDMDLPFPNLTSIEIFRVMVNDVNQFLRIVSGRENFTRLNVSIADYTEEALQVLIQDVASGCPTLEHLVVSQDILDRPSSVDFSRWGLNRLPTVSEDTLEQLQGFHRLKRLSITYYRPSEITDDHFMGLIGALPDLTELKLRCIPSTTECPALTLRVLHRLSEFYRRRPDSPGISELQLQVDAKTWPDEGVGTFLLSTDICAINSLQILTVASSSPITSADNVALYLSQIIPSGTDFNVDNADNSDLPLGSTLDNNVNHLADVAEMESRQKSWFQVSTQLKILQRLQSIISARGLSNGCAASC